MGATVIGYWRDMTEQHLETQPGFANDCKAFGDWIAEVQETDGLTEILEDRGLEALLTFITNGVEEDEVDWVSPAALSSAAKDLIASVKKGEAAVAPLIEAHQKNAAGIDSPEEEFVQDLSDVVRIAEFAAKCGVEEMTLEVNW